jgi:hypothetical protein
MVQELHRFRILNIHHFGVIDITFSVITSTQNFIQNHQFKRYQGVSLHQPQKCKRPPFWNVKGTGLQNMASRSFSMASPPYKISSESTNQFKKCTHLRSLNIRHFVVIDVTFNIITSVQNFIQIHQSVEKLHPPQKFKRPQFWNR